MKVDLKQFLKEPNQSYFMKRFKDLFPDDKLKLYLKNKKRYSKEELLFFKYFILFKIEEAENTISSLSNDKSVYGFDMVDRANVHIEKTNKQNTNYRLRKKIIGLEKALLRIEKGNYGVCKRTGKLIHPIRLFSVPWTEESLK